MIYVNCGCGSRFSTEREWVNIDFNGSEIGVKRHNILKNLPFKNEQVDAVFSSCMLEHFTKEQGYNHIKECYRVLKRGGVIRIVVPDLEDVCKEYLRILDLVREGNVNKERYEYILIELIDQMTRTQSGGEMWKYWQREDRDEEYILERTGYPEAAYRKRTLSSHIRDIFRHGMYILFGRTALYENMKNNNFIKSGELHKWMYDEYNMSMLLTEVGFKNVKRVMANESIIANWEKYRLEMKGDKEYKPHSLYIEAIKG